MSFSLLAQILFSGICAIIILLCGVAISVEAEEDYFKTRWGLFLFRVFIAAATAVCVLGIRYAPTIL